MEIHILLLLPSTLEDKSYVLYTHLHAFSLLVVIVVDLYQSIPGLRL